MLDNLQSSTDALDVAKVAGIRKELVSISDELASRAKVVTLPYLFDAEVGMAEYEKLASTLARKL